MGKAKLLILTAMALAVSAASAAPTARKGNNAASNTRKEAHAQQAGKAGSCIYNTAGAHNQRSPHSVKVAINSYLGAGKSQARASGKVQGVR
jgi:hypothetical protein